MSKVLHDVRQYVAAGLLLYQEGDGLGEDELRARLAMGRRLFQQLAAAVEREVQDASVLRRTVELRDLVDECLSVFRLQHPTVEVQADLRGPLVCFVDREGWHRALTNLLENAARAAGDHGRIEVRGRQREGQITLDVIDDGLGFGTIARQTGHGMQTVDEVVRAARGRLEIRSGPEGGTRVRVRFPCLLREQEAS